MDQKQSSLNCPYMILRTNFQIDNMLSDGCKSTSRQLDIEIIRFLKVMLDSTNELVKFYRMARDFFNASPNIDLKLHLIRRRQQDGRTFSLPTASEVAALIVGDIGNSIDNRDIIVTTKSGSLQHLKLCLIRRRQQDGRTFSLPTASEVAALIVGDIGNSIDNRDIIVTTKSGSLQLDIPHIGVTCSKNRKWCNCTIREFFSYRIQDRVNIFSLILNSRRLFQQFLVDAYAMIERETLYYIRNQKNVKNNRNTYISNIGQRVILPSSFTGGARYMMQNYLDAMSLCKWFGHPDYFITRTCNPNWPEIKRFIANTDLKPKDRLDILSRLFKMKLDSLIKDLEKNSLLGSVEAVVYTVEF
uniref:Helitron helicase-like domain-containing protein n=1 Tax=Lactuca sativa TaxID=4236 RepID=A0A9R1UHY5_LACSA|nr:hypothetical protein LSAT_V11C900487600 [Lactuca sativa]